MNDPTQNIQTLDGERRNARRRKTWISIVVAVLIIFVIVGLSLIAGATFWIRRHINTQFTSAEAATDELNRERARFVGQQPLIELHGKYDEPIVHRRTATGQVELQALHVLAFDARVGKLVNVSIPFWILRLAPSRHVRFFNPDSGVNFDSDRMHLTSKTLNRPVRASCSTRTIATTAGRCWYGWNRGARVAKTASLNDAARLAVDQRRRNRPRGGPRVYSPANPETQNGNLGSIKFVGPRCATRSLRGSVIATEFACSDPEESDAKSTSHHCRSFGLATRHHDAPRTDWF